MFYSHFIAVKVLDGVNLPYLNLNFDQIWGTQKSGQKSGWKISDMKVKHALKLRRMGQDTMSIVNSTNRYDKEIKKGWKVSKYLGKLDKEKGFVPKGQKMLGRNTTMPKISIQV